MSVKSKLLDKIKDTVERREKLKVEIAERHLNVEQFIIKLLKELDDSVSPANDELLNEPGFKSLYEGSIAERIKTLDAEARVEVSWSEDNMVNGILIQWSKSYQVAYKCEPDLFIDIAALLFT